ncbi:MAG TPA: ATP-binding cassette domain-containing protein [Candidatus Babeliales bacterium]|nr:ATP-binding cassette domain-containing protein [Candidatus Babeliales bacterium]
MLKIKSLTKIFHGKPILDAVSFNVNRGQIALLLGQSGVGKSTLLRILNNLESIDGGSLSLDDKELNLTQVNNQHTVGMVFQNFNLFEHLTVEENITISLTHVLKKTTEQAQNIADELLQQYGLADKKKKFVSQLSGGQKQRVALARTLALKPTILCLDEPTSALDPLLTTHVANIIQDLASQGYIILIATHDTMLIEKIDCTIYLMQAGHIIESARSSDFLRNKNIYPRIDAFVSGTSLEENMEPVF